MSTCPICNIGEVPGESIFPDGARSLECSNCGRFKVAADTLSDLEYEASRGKDRRQMLAYLVRRRARPDAWMPVTAEMLQQVASGAVELPNALEQIDNLILALGDDTTPGQAVNVRYATFQAIIGTNSKEGLKFVIDAARSQSLINVEGSKGQADVMLTLGGWKAYREIARRHRSRQAFMAMQYGDTELDAIVDQHFRPAVKLAGFELRRLDDAPEAGLIDNRLRVEVRRSRLLICDLSHDNRGAYFEAGFAEGLGLPVIYTCDSDKFRAVHFDTRQSLFVVWRRDDLPSAAEQLKATIRNTLPAEAVLEDPD